MAKAVPSMAPPVGSLDAKLMSWGAGEIMHRVHDAVYPVDSFTPSPLGNARFSPIRDSAGNVIPTLYAATTPQGALMETIFHDASLRSVLRSGGLRRRVHAKSKCERVSSLGACSSHVGGLLHAR